MTCQSYHISSKGGAAVKNYSSCLAVGPRHVKRYSAVSTVSYQGGSNMGARGLGLGSRSLCGVASSKPRIAISRGSRLRPPDIAPVSVNPHLLQPLHLDIDPSVQMVNNRRKNSWRPSTTNLLHSSTKWVVWLPSFLSTVHTDIKKKWSMWAWRKIAVCVCVVYSAIFGLENIVPMTKREWRRMFEENLLDVFKMYLFSISISMDCLW